MRPLRRFALPLPLIGTSLVVVLGAACAGFMSGGSASTGENDGPVNQGAPLPPRTDGNVALGREVFHFETFGNEGFFTDALRLPAGMMAAGVTPRQMLALGVNINLDSVPAQIRASLTSNPASVLDNPAMVIALLNANSVIGMPVKDSNRDGVLDIARGDKVGTSCALCHTLARRDAVYSDPNGGSIGRREDGLAVHNLNFGKIAATAANSRALYPLLQLSLAANGGKTLGRAPTGLTENSSEAEVDAYLSNPQFYPVGMFDDTFDGNGDPMHITPLFRQDLAGPFGSEGMIARLDNFSNVVYTGLFDPTNLTTPGGRAFLMKLGGAAGVEIADDYVKVLAETGVTGYPFVRLAPSPKAGTEDAPLGIRVGDRELFAMNAYLVQLPAPAGSGGNDQGRALFATAGCVSCHNTSQARPVPTTIVAMKTIFPGDSPDTLAQRMPPLNPVVNTANSIFDDKMAVVNASLRGEKRGIALPLLLDLARKPVFLHDNSVASLDELLSPSRGSSAPHPFYISNGGDRAAMVAYLRGLDTRSR